MEEEFLAAIAATPEDDTHRLIFSDWLEEHGQPDRAEFIRLQCRLDPDRNRFDDDAINALHTRVVQLLRSSNPSRTALNRQEERWFEGLPGFSRATTPSLTCEWRRGFVDTLGVHVGTFIRFGREIRQRYPLLRKLVVFCLNGWGERLAACEWLANLREIELACWYSDDDARAVAGSSHLRSVERVVCWSGGGLGQAEVLARGRAWPNLRELHLVSAFGQHDGWVEAVNAAAGRPVASVYVFDEELFPFAHNFYDAWTEGIYAGKLPDGTQLIVRETYPTLLDGPTEPAPTSPPLGVDALAFDPDGTLRPQPFRLLFPEELWWTNPYPRHEEQKRLYRARKAFLRQAVGFEPAFIRVRGFEAEEWLGRTSRFWDEDEVHDCWGVPDPLSLDPESEIELRAVGNGNGAEVYEWVRQGSFDLCRFGDRETFTRAGRSCGDAFVPWSSQR